MPLSFRTTFTYRSYSIGGGPPPRSRPRESHGAIEFVSLREPTRAPRYIRLGEIERKYRERGGRVLPVRLSPKTGHETTSSPNSFPLWNSRRREGMVDSKQSFRAPIPIPSEFPPFPPQLERDIKRGRHDFLRISNEKTLFSFFFLKVYVDRAVKNNK